MKNKPSCIDLFSGCGGLSLGLKMAGFNIILANENDSNAARAYSKNFGEHCLDTRDCRELLIEFKSRLKDNEEIFSDLDLLTGGPPCQGFSQINRHRSIKDPRNSLVEVFLQIAMLAKPKIILMENVTGLLTLNNGDAIKALINEFDRNGYKSHLGLIQEIMDFLKTAGEYFWSLLLKN